MTPPTLESKTIRPGSLGTYSYYHSNRHPAAVPPRPTTSFIKRLKLVSPPKSLLIVLAVASLIGLPMFFSYNHSAHDQSTVSQSSNTAPTQPASSSALAATAAQPAKSSGRCASNASGKLIAVSISQRRLWACEGTKTIRQSAIITGMLSQESTKTPVGTYQIYGKTTNTTLSGTDATGSWSDPVYYWMPFLDNQHGTYGFHDATWRPDSSFGKVDPNSSDASHGCIELPLGASKWLYNWAPIGTTVTVEH